MTKVCEWCKEDKDINEFALRKKNGKIKPRAECKKCNSARRRELYRTKNKDVILARNKGYIKSRKSYKKEYDKKREADNKEKFQQQRKMQYLSNQEEIKRKRKVYYYKNKEKVIAINTDYVNRNKNKVRARQRVHHKERKQTDLQYSILKNLRSRVGSAIKRGGKKCNKTIDLVGCTMSVLLEHLENKFKDGMNWNNYGLKGWHIDHIIPCSKFDMSKIKEQKKCFHFSNLQPLWWEENLKKGDKILTNA